MTRRTCDAAQLALHEDKPGQRVGASIRILVFLGAALLLSSCAAGPNPGVGDGQDPAGFLIGLWHGLIVPVTFVISLFTEQVNVYEVANRGNGTTLASSWALWPRWAGEAEPARAVGGARDRRTPLGHLDDC